MLADPVSVTYNSDTKSLPRVSAGGSGTRYATSDGEFSLSVNRTERNGGVQVDIMLTRTTPDPTPGPGHNWSQLSNGFGLSYFVNSVEYATATDIPLLRAALLAFVDSTLQDRLINGES